MEVLECESGEEFRTHFRKKICDQISALAIDKSDDPHSLVPSLHSITLPVTEPSSALDHSSPFVNTALLCLLSGSFKDLSTPFPAVSAFLLSEVLLEMRGTFTDIPVDGARIHAF